MYCPKGLETVSLEWMTPENIESVSTPLEEYNTFFIDFINHLDESIINDDYELQDSLSSFLDSVVCGIIDKWLGDSPFKIFPMEPKDDDELTDTQFRGLINALMSYATKSAVYSSETVEQPQEEEVIQPKPVESPQIPLLWHFISLPPPPLMPEEMYPHEPIVVTSPPPPPPCEPPLPRFIILPDIKPPVSEPVHTVTNAMAYRRTRRNRLSAQGRVKTRRSHPAV
jgi:hypothetical protein